MVMQKINVVIWLWKKCHSWSNILTNIEGMWLSSTEFRGLSHNSTEQDGCLAKCIYFTQGCCIHTKTRGRFKTYWVHIYHYTIRAYISARPGRYIDWFIALISLLHTIMWPQFWISTGSHRQHCFRLYGIVTISDRKIKNYKNALLSSAEYRG